MKRLRQRALVCPFVLLGSAMIASAPTMAQGIEDKAGQGDAEARDDGDIVVTARKKEERLQDVPLSIEAFSAKDVDRLGLSSTEAVIRQTPSLVFDKGANPEASSITIRGLAPTRGRSNVAILVDGIDVTTEAIGAAGGGALLNTRLLDIERIEVVRGPQSVQYGRSAFAGGLQYVTRTPSDQAKGNIALEAGDYNRYAGRVSYSGPLIEGLLAVGVAGSAWSEGGFYRDQATLTHLGGGKGYGGSLTAVLTPAPGLNFKARVEYFDSSYAPAAQYLVRSNSPLFNATNNTALATAVAAGVTSNTSFAVYRGTIPDASALGRPLHSPDPLTGRRFRGSDQDVLRASLISAYDVEFGTLTSWTGYTRSHYENRQDFDQDAILSGEPGHQIDTANRTSIQDSSTGTKQYSQELRFASSWGGPVQLTLGGLFWKESSNRDARTITVVCAATIPECANGAAGRVPFVTRSDDPTLRDIRHWSVYGGLDWRIADTVTATVEARYAWEKEKVIGSNCGLPKNRFGVICGDPFATSAATPSVFGPGSLLNDGRTPASVYALKASTHSSESFLTPRFTVEWKPNPDAMLYISAAKGVKPGGTSTLGGGAWLDSDLDGDMDEVAYKSETLWSYEVGGKISWFDGAVQTNLAVFYQDYTDKQVVSTQSTPSGNPIATIQNAGAARVWGAEFEGHWTISDKLGLDLGYAFIDGKYTKFLGYSDTKSGIIDAGECTPIMIDKKVCQYDFSGKTLERSPRHSVIATLSYTTPVSLWAIEGLRFFTETSVSYQSKRYIDQSNNKVLKGYSLTDLRFGFRTQNWDLLGYVDNLFDDDTIRSASPKTGDVDRIVRGLSASTGAMLAALPDPRRFGVRLNYRF